MRTLLSMCSMAAGLACAAFALGIALNNGPEAWALAACAVSAALSYGSIFIMTGGL